MEQIRFAEEAKVSSTNGGSSFDEALKIIYQSISDLNEQLPGDRQIERSPSSVLFGDGGKLDSLGLSNLIVITEQRLQDWLGFTVDLTEDDPFSPGAGHFRTVRSLTAYVCELAKRRSAGAL
jgi:acyl carrier protein